MTRLAAIVAFALLSGCATTESVELLQGRVNALEARLSQNETEVTQTNTNLKKVEDEVSKLATIKSDVNALHQETNSAFKSIAEKLGDIKKQLRKYQIARAKANASVSQ